MAVNPCGDFGKEYENSKCLCASFTTPINDGSNCENAMGVCTPPELNAISNNERYTLKLRARSLNFVGDELVVVLEYPSIATAVTDIAIFTKNGTSISSLQDSLSGSTLGIWDYYTDATGLSCMQVVQWRVQWQHLALLVSTNTKTTGHYQFDITATSHIIREKTKLQIRTSDVAPSILIDVVPITINLNQEVTTSDFKEKIELILDYDVKVKYYLSKVHLDPTTQKVRVVLQHNISFPLSLRSDNLRVSVDGEMIPSRSYEKENKNDCPAIKGSTCQSSTIILFQLPFKANCTEYQLSIDLDLVTKCEGTNDHTSKFLCYGLRKSLTKKSVPVNLPIKYSFCPKIETTEVSVRSFQLVQNDDVLINEEVLQRDVPLKGKIILNIDRIFAGSVFTMAKISSIKIFEMTSTVPQAFYDVVDFSTLSEGVLTSPSTIEIGFSYTPSYQQITTHLQNWASGLYVQVTVDVSFYSPNGLKKNTVADNFHTSVRAQIPNRSLPNYLKRDKVLAVSTEIKISEKDVQKSLEEHKLAEVKIKTDKISDDLKVVQQKNEKMTIITVLSVAACFLVAMVAVMFTIYKIKKSA